MKLDQAKFLKNLEEGYGLFGSLDELKERLPKMEKETLLRELEQKSFLQRFLNTQELTEYYQEISNSDEQALSRKKQDLEYIKLIKQEAKRRGIYPY